MLRGKIDVLKLKKRSERQRSVCVWKERGKSNGVFGRWWRPRAVAGSGAGERETGMYVKGEGDGYVYLVSRTL